MQKKAVKGREGFMVRRCPHSTGLPTYQTFSCTVGMGLGNMALVLYMNGLGLVALTLLAMLKSLESNTYL